MKIFVAIPSYRDQELLATVASIISKADNPKNLSFGMCQQDDVFVSFRQYRWTVRKINSKNYSPEQSLGLGWALSECFSMYGGEEFFLQVDSHTEMDQSWDTKILADYRLASAANGCPCVFSVYPDIYTLDDNGIRQLDQNGYLSRTRLIWGGSNIIPDGNALRLTNDQTPTPARYLNGGFMFGHGSFAGLIPYNPDVYFFGIEIYTTVRCYTHGFELYHPTKRICWHHYGDRARGVKIAPHHGNPVDESLRKIKSTERAERSQNIIVDFLSGRYTGPYGIGDKRSIQDFENYAGIDFKNRCYVTEEAKIGLYHH
jgi:hypothetical protein